MCRGQGDVEESSQPITLIDSKSSTKAAVKLSLKEGIRKEHQMSTIEWLS